jgi:hypothetical protein
MLMALPVQPCLSREPAPRVLDDLLIGEFAYWSDVVICRIETDF